MVLLIYVLIICVSVITCSASPHIISVTVVNKHASLIDDNQVLQLNQPFTLRFQSDESLNSFNATKQLNFSYFKADLFSKENKYFAPKEYVNATKEMADTWTCMIHFSYTNDAKTLHYTSFNLTVTISDRDPRADKLETTSLEQEQWVKEDPLGPEELTMPLNENSFIKIDIRRNASGLVHTTLATVQYNKMFTLIVNVAPNVKLNEKLKNILCYNKSKRSQTYVNEPLTQDLQKPQTYTAVVPMMTSNIGTRWTCELRGSSPSVVPLNLSFDIQVSVADKVEVGVNNVVIVPINSTGSSGDRIAIAEYLFRDGELAKIKCIKKNGFYMHFEWITYNNDKVINTNNLDLDEQTIDMKLIKSLDGSFVACVVQTENTETYTFRLYFKLGHRSNIDSNMPVFNINGLDLTSIRRYDGSLQYNYEYYNGEQLLIKGYMKNPENFWYCENSNIEQLNQFANKEKDINMTVTLSQDDNKPVSANLNCVAGHTNVHLSLNPIQITHYPAISGLSSAQTMQRYRKSEKVFIILYSHPRDKNLTLTCLSDVQDCKWMHNGKRVAGSFYYNKKQDKYTSKLLVSNKSNKKTAIDCACNTKTKPPKLYKTTAVILFQDPIPESTTSAPTITVSTKSSTNLIAQSTASTPSVELTINRDAKNKIQVSVVSSALIPDKEFKIIVIDFKEIITNIDCFFNENNLHTFIKTKLKKKYGGGYYGTGIANTRMKWKWKCQIYRASNKTPLEVEFDVKVHPLGEVVPVVLSVNNKIIKTTASKEEGHFNAKGEYWYREGEIAKITCPKNNGIFMHLQVVFAAEPAPEEIISVNQVVPEQTLYLKLTSVYHESYLTCYVRQHKEDYNVRLYFYKITTISIDYPTFIINDLNLVPTISKDKSLTYQYDYYYGEKLSIVGIMDNTHNKWHCMPTRNDTPLEPVTEQRDFISLTAQLQYDSINPVPPSIDCRIGQTVARLEFKPFPLTSYTTLSGLSLSNTLYRYKESEMAYKIKYRQPQNEVLNLTCFSNAAGSEWDFNDTEVKLVTTENKTFTFNTSTNKYMSQMSFTSRKNIKKTSIACKYTKNINYTYTSTAEILFAPSKLEKPISNAGTTTITNEERTIESPNTVDEDTDSEIPLYLILGYVGATLIVVILVSWMVVSLIKRKRRLDKERETNINYENLPDHNSGAMATPAQWNNYTPEPDESENPYTYVTPPENCLYAQPKDQRPLETLYAEVGAQSELNYASVLPKAQRKQVEYANSDHQRTMPEYGQIQPKSLRNKLGPAPQVLPKVSNDNYAQVLPKSARNVPDGKYTNIYNNERYANSRNATQSDYAEAAYCEPRINYNC